MIPHYCFEFILSFFFLFFKKKKKKKDFTEKPPLAQRQRNENSPAQQRLNGNSPFNNQTSNKGVVMDLPPRLGLNNNKFGSGSSIQSQQSTTPSFSGESLDSWNRYYSPRKEHWFMYNHTTGEMFWEAKKVGDRWYERHIYLY